MSGASNRGGGLGHLFSEFAAIVFTECNKRVEQIGMYPIQ